jgi:hypothetical protein
MADFPFLRYEIPVFNPAGKSHFDALEKQDTIPSPE